MSDIQAAIDEAGKSARAKASKTVGLIQRMPKTQKSGLASTAKVFRFEAEDHKIKKRDATWMWRLWGTVGWSSFNQGWFRSRAVSSREQGHRVSTLGKATSLGFICEKRRMRIALRSTYPFFFGPFFFFLLAAQVGLADVNPAVNSGTNLAASAKSQNLNKSAPPIERDPRVMDAARMYEKYFLNQMVKAMRSTVKYSDLQKPSMGEEIYRDQLDDQYVDSWTQSGGIGLADMIHDELLGKAQMNKLRREAMKASRGKTRTATALTDRDVLQVRRLPSGGQKEGETVLVSLGKSTLSKGDAPETVRSPWDGEIVHLQANHGKVLIGLQAGNRAVQIAFDGVTFSGSVGGAASGAMESALAVGHQIKVGQVLGHLAPGARGILIRQENPKTKVEAEIKPSTTADSGL